MSNKTWLEEFYPVTAGKIANSNDDRDLALHDRQQWIGLLPENLAKHEVFFKNREVYDNQGTFLVMRSSSCGLCIKYIDRNNNFNQCQACPLNKMLGYPCDGGNDPSEGGVYNKALKNPQVMIDALNKVLDMLE